MNIFRDIFHDKLSETMDTDDRGDRVENKLFLMHRRNHKKKRRFQVLRIFLWFNT